MMWEQELNWVYTGFFFSENPLLPWLYARVLATLHRYAEILSSVLKHKNLKSVHEFSNTISTAFQAGSFW